MKVNKIHYFLPNTYRDTQRSSHKCSVPKINKQYHHNASYTIKVVVYKINLIFPIAGGARTEAEQTPLEVKVTINKVTPWSEAKVKESESIATKQAPEASRVEPIH